jgi:hypothetical protein
MAYNKYGNHPVKADGYKFDSKAEARRYQDLKLLLKAGLISDLVVHPRYLLQEKYVNGNGDKIRAAYYEGDFEYVDCETGKIVTEDVKAIETAIFKFKRKLFEKRYFPATITCINVKSKRYRRRRRK